MSLKIKEIELKQFRNYSDNSFVFNPDLTLILGKNATGKTNCIEAIQLLCTGMSFRNPVKGEIINQGCDNCSLKLLAKDENERTVDLQLTQTQEKKTIFLNGKSKTRAKIQGILPVVLFTPDHLKIVKSSPSNRRDALDEIGFQLFPSYRSAKTEYEKVLQQRNNVLKDVCATTDMITCWTESLVKFGSVFFVRRIRLFSLFAPLIKEVYKQIAPNEELEIKYIPSWQKEMESYKNYNLNEIAHLDKAYAEEKINTVLAEVLQRSLLQEKERGISLFGPHKDDIEFYINGRNVRTFGSQGQQRSVVLAWKLAETQLFKQISEQPPVLLLDDVMSELDESRRKMLTKFVKENIQTVITATDTSFFPKELLKEATIIWRE